MHEHCRPSLIAQSSAREINYSRYLGHFSTTKKHAVPYTDFEILKGKTSCKEKKIGSSCSKNAVRVGL